MKLEKHLIKKKYDGHLLSRQIPIFEFSGDRCTSNPTAGYFQTIAEVSHDTPEWNEKFSGFDITGAELTGNNYRFVNSDVTAKAVFEVAKDVTVNTDGHGKIESTKVSGFIGDTASLSNTASAGYTFTGYTTTGAVLTGSNFTFTGSDITAHAGYSANVYNITLQNDGHGTIAANKTTGNIGDTITLSNTPATHYHFSGYTVTGATLTSNKFNLGAQNATAKGWFAQDPTYSVTVQNDGHGTITASPTTGYSNDLVTLSTTPARNYIFNNYSITGATLTGSQFKFGSQNVTAKANFKIIPIQTGNFYITGTFVQIANKSNSYSNVPVTSIYVSGLPQSSLFSYGPETFDGATVNTYRWIPNRSMQNVSAKCAWSLYTNDIALSKQLGLYVGGPTFFGTAVHYYGARTENGDFTGSYSTKMSISNGTPHLLINDAGGPYSLTATFTASGTIVNP